METLQRLNRVKSAAGYLSPSKQRVYKGQAGAVLTIREDFVPGSVSAPA